VVTRLRLLGSVGAAGLVSAICISGLGPASAAVSVPACTKATASSLVEANQLNHFLLPDPVRQVLCGAFTGPGSIAMAVTIAAPTCWPIQNWAVFAFVDGAWKLVLDQPSYLVPPLVAVGSAIRETTAVRRAGDPRCLPSGGTHARLWSWNGSRLAAGPWKQIAPPTSPGTTPSKALRQGFLKTPSGNIQCDYSYGGGTRGYVRCGVRSGLKPPEPRPAAGCGTDAEYVGNRIVLQEHGRAQTEPCAGDAGPFGNPAAARVLRYGTTWTGGAMRCTSAVTGLTCRNRAGHGFFLSRERWRMF
jgi:hypothetical protein